MEMIEYYTADEKYRIKKEKYLEVSYIQTLNKVSIYQMVL